MTEGSPYGNLMCFKLDAGILASPWRIYIKGILPHIHDIGNSRKSVIPYEAL